MFRTRLRLLSVALLSAALGFALVAPAEARPRHDYPDRIELPVGFQPATNPAYVFAQVQGAPGATAADMDRAVADATRILKARPEVANVFANIGGAATGGQPGGGVASSDLRNGSLIVVLKRERELTAVEFKAAMRPLVRNVAGARISFLSEQIGNQTQTRCHLNRYFCNKKITNGLT